MMRKYLWSMVTLFGLILLISAASQAAVVGSFTQVQGQVDLLKQGKLPAVPAKVRDGVAPGDTVRTKSKSRAQIKFVDDTTLTLAPESRITVADYLYNEAQGQRRAVLRVFRGLVHTVVTRLLQTQEPEFIMETHTAVLGVRGTDWYTLLRPNFTSVYLLKGLMDAKSSLATLPAVLSLMPMHFTQVLMGEQPRLAKPITPAMLEMLQHLMDTGLQEGTLLGSGAFFGEGPEGSEFKLPVSPDQMTQPVIPPTLTQPAAPPVQKERGPQ